MAKITGFARLSAIRRHCTVMEHDKKLGLGDFLQGVEDAVQPVSDWMGETEPLFRMIDESGLGSTSADDYCKTISMLQQAFCLTANYGREVDDLTLRSCFASR